MNPITETNTTVPAVTETEMAPASAASPHVQEVIRSAEQELAGLLQRRAEVTRRIVAIKKMLSGLVELFGRSLLDEELSGTLDGAAGKRGEGLTRACRLILMESPTPLRAQQGCELLRKKFPEVAQRHKHLRASITTVFHRLACYAEARCFLDEDGRRVWEWASERAFSPQQNLPGQEDTFTRSIAIPRNLTFE